MLGVGAYGSVYKAYDQVSRQMRAIKCIRTTGLDARQRTFQGHEAKLHALVSGHPNIATLHEVVEEDDFFYMIMDCGLEGDLFSKITERGGYVGKDIAIKSIFTQIAGAVMHCHSKGVFHRDLKVNAMKRTGVIVLLTTFAFFYPLV
jgi:serine/threonine protein kinase